MKAITFDTLKAKFDEIDNVQRANTTAFQNHEKDFDEWVKVYDSCIRKFAGWRKSVINHIAKMTGNTYMEQACIFAHLDNIDLYFKFVREGGNF